MKKRLVVPALALVVALLQTPAFLAAPQNPFGKIEQTVAENGAKKALGSLLNDELPLKLDAKSVYPTVNALPGGPFQPKPLQLTAEDLDKPLPPGDYTLQVLAFCTEYSVHRPGYGVAYELAPMQGKAAQALGALLWRGTIEKKRPPQQLQAVAWGIQSGLRYPQMPKSYQAVIDDVIPEYKNELSGDFVQNTEDTYQRLAASAPKGVRLPPLEKLFADMGKPGELALSAKRQREALLRQNTTDELRTQTLFAGQESGVYTPVKAVEGPWTERIPGVAYVRYKIVGGNMATNNVMEIRVLPQRGQAAALTSAPKLVYARYGSQTAAPSPTPAGLISGTIGYPVGAGAQDLAPVPMTCTPGPGSPCVPAGKVGTLMAMEGVVQVLQPDGTWKTLGIGDAVGMGDTIRTQGRSRASLLFVDNTEMTLSENTKFTIDEYVYNPNDHSGRASYNLLEGAFRYVSGLIAKKEDDVQINTAYGCLGIRGTELIARLGTAGLEVDLISGTVAIPVHEPKRLTAFTAPVKILSDGPNISKSPLTQTEYNSIKQQLSQTNSAASSTPH